MNLKGYQYPIDRDKEQEQDKDQERKESVREKQKAGEEGLVLLSPEERQKLTEKMGGKKAAEYIQKLENYIGSKGKRYRSHYHTILSWWMKDGKPKDSVKIDDSAEKIKRWVAEASPMPAECKEQLAKFGIKSAVA
jgi:hypothetical protein